MDKDLLTRNLELILNDVELEKMTINSIMSRFAFFLDFLDEGDRMNKLMPELNNKPDYFVEMKRDLVDVPGSLHCYWSDWIFKVQPKNGKTILKSRPYANKAQCRNCGKKFAESLGLEWRE